MMIMLLKRYRFMKSPTNIYVLNLAAADFIFLLLCVPFHGIMYFIQYWPFDRIMCIVVNYLQYQAMYLSIFTICAMTLDKLLAVGNPTKWTTIIRIRLTYKILIVIWAMSIIFPFPWIFLFKTETLTGEMKYCIDKWGNFQYLRKYYFLFISTTGYIAPSIYNFIGTVYIIVSIKKKFSSLNILKRINIRVNNDSMYSSTKKNNLMNLKNIESSKSCTSSKVSDPNVEKSIKHFFNNAVKKIIAPIELFHTQKYFENRMRSQIKTNTIGLLVVIFVVFFFSWLPTSISWIWQSFFLDFEKQ
ncbi:G-protein coupled receptor, partial [Intoshia linei]